MADGLQLYQPLCNVATGAYVRQVNSQVNERGRKSKRERGRRKRERSSGFKPALDELACD